MTTNDTIAPKPPPGPVREVPVDWEALEDAFENNAPEVHSYLHLTTGDVLRVVDGVADPQMHARINADTNYLRIAPVSSREQYRWMERYIPMVEDPELRAKLAASIDGKGAFRRFKDVLMSHSVERERWFSFRSERLRTFMEAWLVAHALKPIPRPSWPNGQPPEALSDEQAGGGGELGDETAAVPAGLTSLAGQGVQASPPASSEAREQRRGRNPDALRKHLRDLVEALGPRDLESLSAFAEFLKARRIARAYAHHQEQAVLESGPDEGARQDDAAPVSSEMDVTSDEAPAAEAAPNHAPESGLGAASEGGS
jgi:hypothetical protein